MAISKKPLTIDDVMTVRWQHRRVIMDGVRWQHRRVIMDGRQTTRTYVLQVPIEEVLAQCDRLLGRRRAIPLVDPTHIVGGGGGGSHGGAVGQERDAAVIEVLEPIAVGVRMSQRLPANQSINQSIKQSNNQSNNQSINQSNNQSINQINQSINQSIKSINLPL